jgi:hypothetical protein
VGAEGGDPQSTRDRIKQVTYALHNWCMLHSWHNLRLLPYITYHALYVNQLRNAGLYIT